MTVRHINYDPMTGRSVAVQTIAKRRVDGLILHSVWSSGKHKGFARQLANGDWASYRDFEALQRPYGAWEYGRTLEFVALSVARAG